MGAAPILQAVAKEIPKQSIMELGSKLFGNLERGMSKTDAGKDMVNLLKNKYIPLYHQKLEELATFHMNTPMGNQKPSPQDLHSMARNHARIVTLGPNDYRGAMLIKAVEKQPGLSPLQIDIEKQSLADHVHMFLKDTKENWHDRSGVGRGLQSQFKLNVANSKEFQSKIDTGAHYTPPGEVENFSKRLFQKNMLAFIAIPHIGTAMNFALNTPITALAKGLAEATFHNKDVRANAAGFGLWSGTLSDAYAVRYNGAKGIIATATGSDSFGVIVNQITHQPGFNALREWQISLGAATGKHVAEDMGERLFKSGGKDKFAIYQLRRMSIEPADVMAAGGKINPDMMRKAVFNYVDKKIYLDSSLQRSYLSSANWFTRLAGMYHGYIARQGKQLYDVMANDILRQRGGLVNAAQAFGVLGVVFPTVGVGLKSLEMWGRGQFTEDSNPINNYEKMAGRDGLSAAASEWLEGYTHMGAFGVATDYIRGGLRHELSRTAIGPVGNEIANLGQDALHAATTFKSSDPNKSFKPLEKDIIADSLPDNLGKIIANQVFPKKTKKKSSKLPKLSGMKKLKKLGGIN